MVRAILDGKKTQTRRAVKAPKCATVHGRRPAWDAAHKDRDSWGDYLHLPYGGGDYSDPKEVTARVYCPYGERGDLLWVRETWGTFTTAKRDEAGIHYRDLYRADFPDDYDGFGLVDGWKPSIHMPRRLSRLTLRIHDVRVQRVQDITDEDALAEGVTGYAEKPRKAGVIGGPDVYKCARIPRLQFRDLWDSINGGREGCSWEANPWCWCLTFERVTDPTPESDEAPR
jgi:hypothetical protein